MSHKIAHLGANMACIIAAWSFVNACCGLNPAFVNAWIRGWLCELISLHVREFRQSFGFDWSEVQPQLRVAERESADENRRRRDSRGWGNGFAYGRRREDAPESWALSSILLLSS